MSHITHIPFLIPCYGYFLIMDLYENWYICILSFETPEKKFWNFLVWNIFGLPAKINHRTKGPKRNIATTRLNYSCVGIIFIWRLKPQTITLKKFKMADSHKIEDNLEHVKKHLKNVKMEDNLKNVKIEDDLKMYFRTYF